MRLAGVLLLAAASLRAASPPPAPAAPAFGNAPYDGVPARTGRISVVVDASAAEQILAALSSDRMRTGDASALLALPAVRRQIAEAGKTDADWTADFSGAFLPESRPGTFDLRSVRLDRSRWEIALAGVKLDREEIARLAARRVEALLPGDVPLTFSTRVELTFALAGLEDHIVYPDGEGKAVVLVDLGHAFSENAGTPRADAAETLSRLAAAETFRGAWDAYRRLSPAWQKPPSSPLDPLERSVSAAAPLALFAFDKNFFPLSRWLHDEMLRAIDALNAEGGVLADPKAGLGKRAEILAALRRPGLRPDPSLSAGVYLADAVYQTLGQKAFLDALAAGPDGLFAAYRTASETKKSGLPPLSAKLRPRPPK